MRYVRLDVFLESRPIGAHSVAGKAVRINVDCKWRTTAYGTCKIWTSEVGEPTVNLVRTKIDIPFLWERDDGDYFLLLDGIHCNLYEGERRIRSVGVLES